MQTDDEDTYQSSQEEQEEEEEEAYTTASELSAENASDDDYYDAPVKPKKQKVVNVNKQASTTNTGRRLKQRGTFLFVFIVKSVYLFMLHYFSYYLIVSQSIMKQILTGLKAVTQMTIGEQKRKQPDEN